MVFFNRRRKYFPVTELQYIETTGSQYINTGFKPNNATAFYVDVEVTNTQSHVFGARTAYQNNAFALYWASNSDLAVQLANATFNGGIFSTSGRHTVYMTSTSLSVDGTVTATYSPEEFQCEQDAWLMSCYSSSAAEYAKGKLYGARMYDNEKLIHDFVPCRDKEGNIGCYDTVTKRFYGNAGTGAFIAGPEV